MAAVDGGAVTLLGEATVTSPEASIFVQSASAALVGDAAVVSNMTGVFGGFATITADSQTTSSAQALRIASATLLGEAGVALGVNEPNFLFSVLGMEGESALSAAAEMAYGASADLAGEALIASASQVLFAGSASFSGDAVAVSAAEMSYAADAIVVGDAVVVAAALADDEGAADLVGATVVSANMTVSYSDSFTLAGGSSVTAIGIVRPPVTITAPFPGAVIPNPFEGLRTDRPPHARSSGLHVSTTARTQLVDIDETAVEPLDRVRKVPRSGS